MTTAGTISVGVEIVGHDLAEKLAAQIRKDLAPQIAKINKDLQRQYAETDRAAEKSAATQVAAARTVTHAVGEIGEEHEKTAAKAAAAAKLQSREITMVTRDIEKQTAALAANTAARAANAAAPTGGPPSGGGGSVRGGTNFGGGGGRGRGGIGGFLTGPVGLNSVALGASALPAATLAVTNLAGAVQQLVQSGGVLPGVFAGIATSVATLKIGLSGVSDGFEAAWKAAASGDPKDIKKATEAMEGLAPAAKTAISAVVGFRPQWQRLQRDITQQNIFDGLDKSFTDLANKSMPTLERGLGGVSKAWNGTFKELGRVGGLDSTQGFLDKIFGNTAEAQTRANKAIEPLIHAIGTLTSESSDFLPRLADGFGKLTGRFDTWITKVAGNGQLDKWIDQGIDAVGHFGESLLNIGKIFTSVTQAAGGDGGLLKLLDDGTTKLAAFLGSAEGQQKLTAFFTDARARLAEWIPILGHVAQVVGDVFKGFQQWGDAILPLVGGITSLLSNMPGLVTGAVTAFLGFATLSGLDSVITKLTTINGLVDGGGTNAGGKGSKRAGRTIGTRGAIGGGLFLGGLVDGTDGGPGVWDALSTIGGGALIGGEVAGAPGAMVGTVVGAVATALQAFAQDIQNTSGALDTFASKLRDDADKNPVLNPGAGIEVKPSFVPIPGNQITPDTPLPNGLPIINGIPVNPLIGGPPVASGRNAGAYNPPVQNTLPGIMPGPSVDQFNQIAGAAQDASGKVGELGNALTTIKAPPSIAIKVDTAGALADVKAFAAQAGSISVTVPLRVSPTSGSATAGGSTWFGGTPHRADGGVYPGYAPGVDSLLSWVSPGEGVLIPEAVRGLGGPAGIFSINSRFRSGLSRRGYADGGVVPGALLPGADGGLVAAFGSALAPVLDLLASIRDALGGKASGPISDTAAATTKMAAETTGAAKAMPFGGDIGKGALAGAVKALGGDTAGLFSDFDGEGRSLIPIGGGAAGSPSVVAALSAFAKSGDTADIAGTGLNAGSPVVSAIVAARNKKKGGLADDDIAGLVQQIVGGGEFSGVLDTSNSSLVKSLTSFNNRAGNVPSTAGLPAAGGLGSNPLGFSGGGPVPVYIVSGPGGSGLGGQIGGDVANSALQAGGQVLSNVSGDLIDGLNKATQLQKNSTLTKPTADTASLLKGGNPAGVASLLGYRVPDFSRNGGDPAGVTRNDGPGFNANGQVFSDTATLIQRSFTDMEAANQARHEQMMAILDGIKTQLSESVLKPIIQSAVQAAMSAAGSAAQGAAGGSAIPGLAGGGGIWGGVPGRDSVPAMLMPGEHVLTTTDVARMGGQSGVYAFRGALARTGGVQGFATGGGVSGNDTVGADFFGVSQIPILGAIINLIVKTLLEVIGVNIEVADTLNEISDNFRKFRGDFKAFDASGRIANDTSGLTDRTGSSEQKAIDERVRIFKQVLTGLIKYIIQKIIIPIAQAVMQTLLSTASSAVGGAISGGVAAAGGGPAGGIAGSLVTGLMNSAGGAAINIGGQLINDIAGAAIGPIVSLLTDGFMGFFGKFFAPILSGGIGGFLSMLFPFLAFDDGGMANGMGLLPKATVEPERVLSPRQTTAFEDMVRANFGSGAMDNSKSVTAEIHMHGSAATPQAVRDGILALLS